MVGSDTHERRSATAIAIGVAFVLLGVALWLDRSDLIGWHAAALFAPVLLIAVGIARIAAPCDGRRRGGWLLLIGVLLLLHQLDVLRFHQSWPLFLVAVGVSMLWGRKERSHA